MKYVVSLEDVKGNGMTLLDALMDLKRKMIKLINEEIEKNA